MMKFISHIFPSITFSVSNWYYLLVLTSDTRAHQLLWQSKGLDTSYIMSLVSRDQSIYLNTQQVPQATTSSSKHMQTHTCTGQHISALLSHLDYLKNKTRFNSPENSQTRLWIVFWLEPIFVRALIAVSLNAVFHKRRRKKHSDEFRPKKCRVFSYHTAPMNR